MFNLKKAFVPALLAGIVAAGSAAAAPASRLTSQIELDQTFLTNRDDVNVRFTLRNDGAEALSILKWQTPFFGVDDDLFSVGRNGFGQRCHELDRRPLIIGELGDRFGQTRALDELHREIMLAVVLADFINWHDPRMI